MKHAIAAAGILLAVSVLVLAVISGKHWSTGQVLGALFFVAGGLTPAAFYLSGGDE